MSDIANDLTDVYNGSESVQTWITTYWYYIALPLAILILACCWCLVASVMYTNYACFGCCSNGCCLCRCCFRTWCCCDRCNLEYLVRTGEIDPTPEEKKALAPPQPPSGETARLTMSDSESQL
jgi:hypothetical protein